MHAAYPPTRADLREGGTSSEDLAPECVACLGVPNFCAEIWGPHLGSEIYVQKFGGLTRGPKFLCRNLGASLGVRNFCAEIWRPHLGSEISVHKFGGLTRGAKFLCKNSEASLGVRNSSTEIARPWSGSEVSEQNPGNLRGARELLLSYSPARLGFPEVSAAAPQSALAKATRCATFLGEQSKTRTRGLPPPYPKPSARRRTRQRGHPLRHRTASPRRRSQARSSGPSGGKPP